MNQHFVNKINSDELVIFFAGWGINERILSDNQPFDKDLLICFDYRNPFFDFEIIEKYKKIKLVAWSFGVWMAAKTLHLSDICFSKKIAFNGTMFPIDKDRGISQDYFDKTTENLSEQTLIKFNKRMCGNSAVYNDFEALKAQRNVAELKEELISFKENYYNSPEFSFNWDEIYVGDEDRIFIPNNQKMAWSNKKINLINAFHYDGDVLKKLIYE